MIFLGKVSLWIIILLLLSPQPKGPKCAPEPGPLVGPPLSTVWLQIRPVLYTRGSSGVGSGEGLPANQWGSDSLGSVPASSAPAKTIINIKG